MMLKTYGHFHRTCTIPFVLATGVLSVVSGVRVQDLITSVLMCCIAVTFTFPWDNAAVARGLWSFPRERYSLRIGNLPIEEVLFFVLQTMIVSLLITSLIKLTGTSQSGLQPNMSTESVIMATAVLVVGWLIAVYKGKRSYAHHLLLWILPLIAAQWILGYNLFMHHLNLVLVVTTVCGLYLSFCDALAIRDGLWSFGKDVSTTRLLGLLPWEEIVFFILTSLLVAQSTLLLLPSSSR